MNLSERFLERVESAPESTALITAAGESLSYGELARRASQRAVAMRSAGIGAGDVVLIAHGVSAALYETLLAVFHLGAVAMFPEPAAGLPGLRQAITAAKPVAIATSLRGRLLRLVLPWLHALPVVGEPARGGFDAPTMTVPGDAPALMTFTSGSTGRPKGIVRSVDFLLLQHELLENLRQTTPDDVDLISLPVFILSNLAAGATSVIPVGKLTKPATLDGRRLRAQIATHAVNRVVAPPVVCKLLAQAQGEPLDRLEAVFTGGGPVFPNLLHALAAAAPDAKIHAVYGSTEAEPIAHLEYADVTDTDFKAMATGAGLLAGAPIPEIDVDIVDDELCVSGAHVNTGYLDSDDDAATKFRRDGRLWHRTGDAARVDERGRLWLLGRVTAGSAGRYPFAYETAALSWPGVSAAAMVSDDGVVTLAVSGQSLDVDSLRERARELGDVGLVQLDSIPMDARHNSKVDYARLRALLGRR